MNIRRAWQSFYGQQVPISYVLREQITERWFRIHSLPESKRYAENEEETQEILRRHNTVAAEVLDSNSMCAVFFPNYVLGEFSSVSPAVLDNATVFCSYEDDHMKITQWASPATWKPHKFDAILRLVARDQIRWVSWMNLESGEIFAPYDGGADLFLSSTPRRAELRERYSEWLSPYPEGL